MQPDLDQTQIEELKDSVWVKIGMPEHFRRKVKAAAAERGITLQAMIVKCISVALNVPEPAAVIQDDDRPEVRT